MNAWDLFTWLMAATLGGSAVVILVLFVRDARGVMTQQPRQGEDEPPPDVTSPR